MALFDCFTIHLTDNGNLYLCYDKFYDIYDALISAYKKSIVNFRANIPNRNQRYGFNYTSMVSSYSTSKTLFTVFHIKIRKAIIIQRFYKKRFRKRLLAILVLQRRFREAIGNPYTQICKRRLLTEFNELNEIK